MPGGIFGEARLHGGHVAFAQSLRTAHNCVCVRVHDRVSSKITEDWTILTDTYGFDEFWADLQRW